MTRFTDYIFNSKGETNNTILFVLVGVATLVILVLGIILTTKTNPPQLEQSSLASLEFAEDTFYDWGEIDIFGGNVEKVFTVRNTGEDTLMMTNFKTSCMCTEVQVDLNGETSPRFGMHSASGWVANVEPGEEAQIRVIYDPLAHGPNATGPVTRFVSFSTNDSDNPTPELRVSANVVKN